MRRILTLVAVALLAALLAAGAATAAGARFGGIDTSGYPLVRVLVVTPKPTEKAPPLTENGNPVYGLQATNLGRAKSVVLAVDPRSRCEARPSPTRPGPRAGSWR